MSNIRKCIIKRYDETIKEPEGLDDGGSEFAIRLRGACLRKGYKFRFYSMSEEEGYDYELTVWNESGLV